MKNQQSLAPPAPVPHLTRLGRSADADLLYRTLVVFGPATAEDLTRKLGLARSRVRCGLEELRVAGIADPVALPNRRGIGWRPHPPATVLARLRQAGASSGNSAVPDVARLQHAAVSVATGGRPLTIGQGIRHLPSRTSARQRLGELVAAERHEHLAMNPEPGFDAEAVRGGLLVAAMLRSRGIAPRTLGVMPTDQDLITRELAALAPDYRQAPLVPMKLFVIDRRVALFPVTPTDPEQGYLEVTQPAVVAALAAMFDEKWDATPRNPTTMTLIKLSPREQALLALLSAGHTDISAAAELRLSPRSVSSIVRGLMDRFGVDNRFQLGLALGALSAAPLPSTTLTSTENTDA